jgi:hypothetical protein
VSFELHVKAALTPVKNLSTHSIGGWVAPQGQFGCFGEKKNFLFLLGI